MTNRQAEYSSILERQAFERLASLGMEVILHPKPRQLPPSPVKYQPDLLAIAPDGTNYIIEVKSSAFPIDIERYFEYSRSLPKNDIYKFILITEREIIRGLSDLLISLEDKISFTLKNIELAKRKIPQLILDENTDESIKKAIYIMRFANIESLLSLIAEKSSLPIGELNSRTVVNYLYSEGEIEYDLYNMLLEALDQRNKIVHSKFSYSESFDMTLLDKLQDELIEILKSLDN
ncbi:hypothetical protein K7W42_20340 [Deinococcus sp. HMF7604]|uniref:hypothetical protein n=1 Tax=Deinococcus betulae TaxID=2873312 RepID=UPI001CCC5A98|nr:hypothetical protein [Deinococcus betulae]MBZ9753189.1 hypothetical protein [Deinococcus betulae]